MKRLIIYVLSCLLCISCSKNTPADMFESNETISFYVYEPEGGVGSKAIVDDAGDLKEKSLPMHVTDLMSFHAAGVTPISEEQFDLQQSGLWGNNTVRWKDRLYEFYAYVISQPSSSSAENDNDGWVYLRTVGESHPGRYIDIYEPIEYQDSDDEWADYLLSYRTEVNGAHRPLVRLDFERVTTEVQLYVATPAGSEVRINRVMFTNVLRCARMSIAEHAVSSSSLEGRRNKWVIQSISGKTQTTDYEKASDIEVKERSESDDRFSPEYLVMNFLTVPQDISEDTRLIIDYEVNENGQWMPYTVNLAVKNPTIYRWDIGRRTRYYVSLDTSVSIEAVIDEWNEVDYLSGTFLPALDSSSAE